MNKIIGYEIEKKRIEEIADVLKNHEKYQQRGITIPKGLLLSGPAGVGKTMFAKYLAEMSSAAFFNFSPSSGDDTSLENAAKLKKLFEEAKKHTPSIVFVDELDNYLPDYYFNSDRNRDFLATILKALDGDGYEGIMFVGACIDYRDIPSQVIRSGRIDESIILFRPNIETRREMINYYLSKVDLKVDFDIRILANRTSGFVGADIKNLVNMTSRIAVRTNRTSLTLDDFIESIYTIRHKDIKKDNDEHEKYQIALHEIGHLIVGRVLLHRSFDVTIDSYDYIKGMVVSLDDDSTDVDNKDYYINQITTSLGGKAAEDICLKSSTSGCYSDINKAIRIIENMFQCGMCGFQYLDFALSDDRCDWSQKQVLKVEKKTKQILDKCYKLAKVIIRHHLSLVYELADILMDKTVMVAEESDAIFKDYGM